MYNLLQIKLMVLDGGGVRGISAILQLGLIMKTVNRKLKRPRGQHLLPWQVFSLIGGTSTGGILAVMLGRLKMSTDECLDEYCKLSKIVFQPKRARADIPRRAADRLTADERFDADVLEQQIRAVIEKKIGDADIPLMDDEGEISPCRVFVCSKMSSVGHVSLLRSYENENQPDSISDRCKLWEACRATSAASTFFSPCKIAGRVFIDGALGMNNPVEAVWQEAKDLWGDGNTVIISLGTGEKPSTTTHEGLTGIVKTLEEIATETQNTANRFIQRNNDLVERDFYYRFNVPGLGRVGLHEYQRVELLEEQTDGYLNRHEISQRLLRCAEKLREVCQSPLFGTSPPVFSLPMRMAIEYNYEPSTRRRITLNECIHGWGG
ncbi:acyl transferase/acyl hydrolase/lysophospholipase [Pseudomassariella vexata]|uniref:Acyl transferase/acyl hydrolase/lysophospholipase n=1 Tax=Pseudomassariella vexata TaxID=1141098 RepID=A0A1Y2E1C0_9PEZI|nr:acyl transferase/acyl hydrolase/lysophospholipase [Pseudomassariella vexata]ORY65136.1 acyl transferase/acyl hydrolase/lysophospholipase [Pseudomassariella vexata]